MTRCRIHPCGAITIHVRRHWLSRLLGAEDVDAEVQWSGVWWVNADTGRPMTPAVCRVIERTVGR